MNQPPLNPDALEASAAAARIDWSGRTDWNGAPNSVQIAYRNVARAAVSAYLAAALPEVTSVESIPAKINLISWDGQHELDADLAPDETLVVLTVKTDRSWSLGDKAELTIHRPEVKP